MNAELEKLTDYNEELTVKIESETVQSNILQTNIAKLKDKIKQSKSIDYKYSWFRSSQHENYWNDIFDKRLEIYNR